MLTRKPEKNLENTSLKGLQWEEKPKALTIEIPVVTQNRTLK